MVTNYLTEYSKTHRQEQGFTLLEIILVLMLLSILGTMGSLGLITYAKSFNIARDATQTMGAGQLAMLRMAKDFVAINSVTSASASAITFKTQHADGEHTFTISKSGTNLILSEGGVDDTLASQVDSFTLEYYEWDEDTNALVLTSPGAWVNEVACCNSITVTPVSAECSGGELKIKFTDDINGVDRTFKVTYDGAEHGSCVHEGDHFHASNDAGCSDKEVTGQNWYSKAYLWDTTSGSKCYAEIDITNDNDDLCSVGGGTNPTPSGLIGGTKIIKTTLTISGSQPFTISAAPRNISNNCP